MNKLTKLLSVFILAGAVGAGVAGVSACKSNDDNNEPTHTHSYTYTPNNDGTHNGTCNGTEGTCDAPTISNEACVDNKNNETQASGADGKCDKCGATVEQSSQLVVAANVTGLLIEGVTQETITLSETNQSHTIDKSAVKVYFATGNNADVKGDAVPADNLVLELKDDKGAAVSSWEGIRKDGVYKVNASLKNAKMASGALVTVDDLKATVTVTISNPVKAGSLVVKAGATLEQPQSVNDKMTSTWTYEVTLANGDKQDVPAADVTISNLDTGTVAASATANLTWGTITGTVTYKITENANRRVQSYAYNFGVDTHTGAYKDDAYIIDNKATDHSGTYVKIPGSGDTANGVKMEANKPRTSVDNEKFFSNRFTFGGGTYKTNGDFDTDAAKKKYIEIKTESAGKITVYWSRNSSADNRGLALWKAADATSVNIGTDSDKSTVAPYDFKGKDGQNTPAKLPVGVISNINSTGSELLPEKYEFVVPEAGTYYLTTATKQAVYLYYIQIDNEYDDATKENITIQEGEKKLSNISVSHSSDTETAKYKPQFNLGETFTVDGGFTFKGVTVDSNTADKSEATLDVADLEFWLGEAKLTVGETILNEGLITTTGDKTITVKKGDVSVTYTINVASALGVDTISVAVNNQLSTLVNTETDKVNVNWEHLTVTTNGTNTNVDVTITGVTYVAKDAAEGTAGTEIAQEGTELGVGDWVLTVTATVTDKTNASLTDTFTASCNLKIAVKGQLTEMTISFDSVLGAGTADITKTENTDVTLDGNCASNASLLATADKSIKIKYKANTTVADGVKVNTCFSTQGSGSTTQQKLKLDLTEGATYTVTVYAKSGSSSDATRKASILVGAEGTDKRVAETATPTSGNPTAFVFENITAGTIYIGGEAGIDIYYIVITPNVTSSTPAV